MWLGLVGTGPRAVPATVTIFDASQKSDSESRPPLNPNYKYDHNYDPPILLVPQPTDDPNDPLTWPRWRRDLILMCLSLLSVIGTTLTPMLAANSLVLAFDFVDNGSILDLNQIALLTGWHLLAVGIAALVFVPSARVWGKRHLYLLGACLMCGGCAWAGAVGHSYKSLIWARIVQGIGLAPFEALVNSSVGDLYFVHERGKRMALSTLALFGGAFFTPVIAGVITDAMGWRWTFNFVAIFSGAFIPILFFFVPETAYKRPPELELSEGTTANPTFAPGVHVPEVLLQDSNEASSDGTGSRHDAEKTGENGNGPVTVEALDESTNSPSSPTSPSTPRKASYLRTLLPFNGRKTDESFFKLALRPFPLFLQPAIAWACLTQGTIIGWTVLIGIVLSEILIAPPLFFVAHQIGYMYSGAFIGSIVGFVIAGLTADSSAKFLTKRNKGVYEPEFRIPVLAVFQLIFAGIGLYGFGITAADPFKYYNIPPAVFFGFEVASMVCGAVCAALYVVDAHRDISIEALVCMIAFKNIFSFGLTVHGWDWIGERGIRGLFDIVASVQVGVCLLALPMYMFGKWNRLFWARYDYLRILRLR